MEVNNFRKTKVFVITPDGCVYQKGVLGEETKHRKCLLDIANILYPNNCLNLQLVENDLPLDVGNALRMFGNVVILNSPSYSATDDNSKYLIVLAPNYCTGTQDAILRYYLYCFPDYKLDYSFGMPCVFDYKDLTGFATTDVSLTPLEAYNQKVLKLTKKSVS